MVPEGYMSIVKACELLRTGRSTLRKRIEQGHVRVLRHYGLKYVSKEDVMRLTRFRLTARDVARRLGMGVESVYKWAATNNDLPSLMMSNRHYYNVDDVVRLEKKLELHVSVTCAIVEFAVDRGQLLRAIEEGVITPIGFGNRQCCYVLREDVKRLGAR
jgi:predicted site-specific integrase-resolvase